MQARLDRNSPRLCTMNDFLTRGLLFLSAKHVFFQSSLLAESSSSDHRNKVDLPVITNRERLLQELIRSDLFEENLTNLVTLGTDANLRPAFETLLLESKPATAVPPVGDYISDFDERRDIYHEWQCIMRKRFSGIPFDPRFRRHYDGRPPGCTARTDKIITHPGEQTCDTGAFRYITW